MQLKCTVIGDAATLIWAQKNTDALSFDELKSLLRDRYGSEKQEEKL